MQTKKVSVVIYIVQILLVISLLFYVATIISVANGQATIETVLTNNHEYHNVFLKAFIEKGTIKSVEPTIPFSFNAAIPVIVGSPLFTALALNLAIFCTIQGLPHVVLLLVLFILLNRMRRHEIFTTRNAELLKKTGIVGLILSLLNLFVLPLIVHSVSQGYINVPLKIDIQTDLLVWLMIWLVGKTVELGAEKSKTNWVEPPLEND